MVMFWEEVPLREQEDEGLKGERGGDWMEDWFMGGMEGAVGRAGGGMKGELGPISDCWAVRVLRVVGRDVGPASSERMAPLVAFGGERNWRE